MGKFNKLEVKMLNGNDVNVKTLNAEEYNNLPKSSPTVAGVIKIDGITLIENENGTISIKLPSTGPDGDVKEHMEDLNIHVSNEDRRNLINLNTHMSRNEAHFQFGEKEKLLQALILIIESLNEHLGREHLYDDVQRTRDHIDSTAIHLDNQAQKDEVIKAIANYLDRNQGVPNKILTTDANGLVVLSELTADVLEYLKGITEPIESMFAEKFHVHDEYSTVDISFHTDDNTVHFVDGEKQQLQSDVENIKSDIESLNAVSSSVDRVKFIMPQRKMPVRYIRHTMYVPEDMQDLSWVNLAIYKDKVNIAPNIPAMQVTTDMAWTHNVILKWLDGNTTDIVYTHPCSCLNEHYVTVDLGSVRNDISHIRLHNSVGDYYNMRVDISLDGVNWTSIFDTKSEGIYQEDKYGKIHILNYEPYVDYLHG